MSVKLYELPRRDRSGFARGCRSLKFPSRARIVDMLNLVRALVCVLILVLSGTEQGQAQDARAPYPRIGTARSVPDGERHGVFDTKAQCESAKTHFESAATPRVTRLFVRRQYLGPLPIQVPITSRSVGILGVYCPTIPA